MYYFIFFLCISSRLLTSIYYIEDIDSLRFAYSIIDEYNLLKLQPHFPGYAIFCFIANLLYHIIGNMGITFSIIGGISIFIIIYFSLKLINFDIYSKEGIVTALLIFFNPLFWLMSNRYMPDLLGLAFFIIAFYFLSYKDNKNIYIGTFFIGILAGIRISYLPLLLIPLIVIFINNKNKLLITLSLICGVIIWLLPMIYITGTNNLLIMALKHTAGHFTEYGGTVLTESDWIIRLKYFIHTFWADGLGGYWEHRSFLTILLSILLIPLFIYSAKYIKSILNNHPIIMSLLLSTFIYFIWIFLFQNIIYKSRHIMPIVLVLIIIFSLIIKFHLINKIKFYKTYLISLIIIMSIITINLSIQHKEPTAIYKVSQYLKHFNQPITIISIPLINYYLKSQNINAKYIDIDNINEKNSITRNLKTKKIFVIGNFKELIKDISLQSDTSFYHNPYVNRMWSTINIYSKTNL